MDRENIKLMNQLTRSSPYFEKFNSQKYRHLKGYADHERILFELARMRTCYQAFDIESLENDFAHKVGLIVLEKAYQSGFKHFWLSESLFEAFNKTEMPENGINLKKVVPVGLLLLPPKLRNPDGQFIKWLVFYHRSHDESLAPIEVVRGRIHFSQIEEESISWCTMLDDGTQYGIGRRLSPDKSWKNETGDVYINERIEDMGLSINTKTETEFTNKVTDILLQTLLYLQLAGDRRPNEYAQADSSRLKQKLGKNHRFEPYIVGKEYQPKTERSTVISPVGGGDGRTVATHWRRGYYRWQPYGSREKPEHKLIWIEPVLVNSP
ncbi:MAG: hypothetical protein N5P05_004172 (plasmid) [Chroococcopsis gigantea SAG 12.99]|jgi:hypothetical protein|nr:hypothetical protein [Chroococcopsis gigantea SAG 12.99]